MATSKRVSVWHVDVCMRDVCACHVCVCVTRVRDNKWLGAFVIGFKLTASIRICYTPNKILYFTPCGTILSHFDFK